VTQGDGELERDREREELRDGTVLQERGRDGTVVWATS